MKWFGKEKTATELAEEYKQDKTEIDKHYSNLKENLMQRLTTSLKDLVERKSKSIEAIEVSVEALEEVKTEHQKELTKAQEVLETTLLTK